MTATVTGRRFGVLSPVTATVLGAVVLVLTAISVPLASPAHQLTFSNVASEVVVILIYTGVGVVVARRQPRNPIGWILLIFVLLVAVSTDAGYYAVLAYRLGYRGLPLAPVAVLLEPLYVPAVGVFPPGHLVVPGRAGAVALAVGALGLPRDRGVRGGGRCLGPGDRRGGRSSR